MTNHFHQRLSRWALASAHVSQMAWGYCLKSEKRRAVVAVESVSPAARSGAGAWTYVCLIEASLHSLATVAFAQTVTVSVGVANVIGPDFASMIETDELVAETLARQGQADLYCLERAS